MSRLLNAKYFTLAFLCLACVILAILWLPQVQYPISKDAVTFALLGEGFWQTGVYSILGEPHEKHIPLFPILSYPFVSIIGYSLGMKLVSLICGFVVLIASFFTVRRLFSLRIAVGVVGALLVHHGFIYLSGIGYSDLLFTSLFLFFIYCYARTEDSVRWYLAAGILMGLATLTRYNGLPLFALYVLFALFARRQHMKSVYFWLGGVCGVAVLVPWFIHNIYYFGSIIPSSYSSELNTDYIAQFISNIQYYLNPLHNVLPLFFVTALVGMWRSYKTHTLVLSALIAIWIMTSIWPVQGLRFAFPGYPFLLAFSFVGIGVMMKKVSEDRRLWIVGIVTAIAVTHMPVICMYSYGSCNAAFDRNIGILPKDIGLTQEWVHSWNQARIFVNTNAEENATVLVGDAPTARVWAEVFREDITVTDAQGVCPTYRIDQNVSDDETVLFRTKDKPHVSVRYIECKN